MGSPKTLSLILGHPHVMGEENYSKKNRLRLCSHHGRSLYRLDVLLCLKSNCQDETNDLCDFHIAQLGTCYQATLNPERAVLGLGLASPQSC